MVALEGKVASVIIQLAFPSLSFRTSQLCSFSALNSSSYVAHQIVTMAILPIVQVLQRYFLSEQERKLHNSDVETVSISFYIQSLSGD